MERFQRIENKIKKEFSSFAELVIEDESRNHAGRKGQESHFKILLVSDDFIDKNRVQRQRLLNDLLKEEFTLGLHALSLRLLTCEEWQKNKSSFQSPQCQSQKK